MTSRRHPSFVIAAAYVVAYGLVARLTFTQPALTPPLTPALKPWNPQAGLTLAFLPLMGARWAIAVPIAAASCEVLLYRSSLSASSLVLASLWIGATYAALAIALRQLDLVGPIRTAFAAGAGGFQRLAPTGDAANGTPR